LPVKITPRSGTQDCSSRMFNQDESGRAVPTTADASTYATTAVTRWLGKILHSLRRQNRPRVSLERADQASTNPLRMKKNETPVQPPPATMLPSVLCADGSANSPV
jgi:hypothetical protein